MSDIIHFYHSKTFLLSKPVHQNYAKEMIELIGLATIDGRQRPLN